ncbi:MAG: EAL domain-containing protein [Lachnospiraceae bacterium]|nr:EAL domain-containing protein [Lachnospiraceae bacterium]
MTDPGKKGGPGLTFSDNIEVGAIVYRAAPPHELLYANLGCAELFECADEEEFRAFVGDCFEGIPNETGYAAVEREIEAQMSESDSSSGYVFYNIRTKKGNSRRLVNHWTRVSDENEGELIYGYLFRHREDSSGSDLDGVTGLYGKRRLQKHITQHLCSLAENQCSDHAIVYLNLVNFKLLNIERGAEEGDACLKHIAEVLRKNFGDAFIARISDDHFAIYTVYEQVLERTREAEQQFHDSYGRRFEVLAKFGIYRIGRRQANEVEAALSYAKLACDYIKYDKAVSIMEYSHELAKKIHTREYVVERLDEAIEKEWVQVYYQPVVRSLTGWLCGMESLIRWDDPKMGFLRPDQFIRALEEERCIHKLDCFVVEKVCACIHDRVAAGLPMVPVSVNFSRLDFILCDMPRIVEAAVRKYDIPRDFIHIEITESMIASDEELMREVIERFRRIGYEVWMDDFGSGYSSLTLLKEYSFDMLKLDMSFLSPFTEKSRSIVRSVVSMAKDIGMPTLAEGVETKEQLEFLREVGCGMIQGFYYGRPEPIDKVFDHLQEKNIPIETRRWRHFYEVAALNIRATDYPLEIAEYDGDNFRTLFMNRAYREQIFDEELSLEEIDRRIYSKSSPLLQKYVEYMEQLKRSRREETFYYTAAGSFYCLRAMIIAENSGKYLFKGTILNISHDPMVKEKDLLDRKLREINLLFEEVLLMNVKQNTIVPLLGTFDSPSARIEAAENLRKVNELGLEKVYPADRERVRRFANTEDMLKRVENSPKGYTEEVFRVRDKDGNYRWMEHYQMLIPGSDGNEFLYCSKPFTEKNIDRIEEMTQLIDMKEVFANMEADTLEQAKVLKNAVMSSEIMFFWKDMEGRYQGASRAFLEYFGLEDVSELKGKTGIEMGWMLDEKYYLPEEEKVLAHGENIRGAFGKIIVRGIVREICYDKIPLYEKGKIVGLAGVFVDWDEEQARVLNRVNPLHMDLVTGLLNAHAFADTLIEYSEQYHDGGRDYGLLVFRNTRHEAIASSFGEEYVSAVLREMADVLIDLAGVNSVIARTRGPVFALLTHMDSREGLESLAEQIVRRLEGITEVEGSHITLRIRIFSCLRSELDMEDEAIYEMALGEISGEG